MTHKWDGLVFSHQGEDQKHTGCDINDLKRIGEASVDYPDTFNVHSRLRRMFANARIKGLENSSVDWATAEALAFGSLIEDGYNVRISGEDV